MKIYLDTSALNRPFDNLAQPRIALEALAVKSILLLLESGAITLVASDALAYEVSRHPYAESRLILQSILKTAISYQPVNTAILQRGQELERNAKIGHVDALHLACAEVQNVDYFITCDDRLIKRYRGMLNTINPTAFVLLMSQQKDT